MGRGQKMTVQAKHRRRTRRERPHEQFTIAIAILSLVMAGGMVAGAATITFRPDTGSATSPLRPDTGSAAPGSETQLPPEDPSNTTRLAHLERITGEIRSEEHTSE